MEISLAKVNVLYKEELLLGFQNSSRVVFFKKN